LRWLGRQSCVTSCLDSAGDFEAAQDLEFIIANKITRILNCSGREIANAWERSGIRYGAGTKLDWRQYSALLPSLRNVAIVNLLPNLAGILRTTGQRAVTA
jgi:hypothetical protein